jgi:hypothetical protein
MLISSQGRQLPTPELCRNRASHQQNFLIAEDSFVHDSITHQEKEKELTM